MDELETQLIKSVREENWEEFIDLTLINSNLIPLAFVFYDQMPDSMKYQFAVDAYISHGDAYPQVRKAIRGLRKYGSPVLPEEMTAAETVTIYRGGEEDITKCKYRISWTTDYEKALWFYNRLRLMKRPGHLYKGTIRTADIIAYCDDRKEKEVMQYRKVYNVTEITPGEDRCRTAPEGVQSSPIQSMGDAGTMSVDGKDHG